MNQRLKLSKGDEVIYTKYQDGLLSSVEKVRCVVEGFYEVDSRLGKELRAALQELDGKRTFSAQPYELDQPD